MAQTSTAARIRARSVTIGLIGLLAACSEQLPPPADFAVSAMPSASGLEPSRAASTFLAAPVGEMRATTTTTMAPTHRLVALGRTAGALGGNELLDVTPNYDQPLRTSIVDDRDAIELMLLGRMDLAVTAAPLSPRDQQAGLHARLLGAELFALAVADNTSLRQLSADDVRRLLTGAVTDGAQLGLPSGPIALGVPADRGTRDRAAHAMIRGDSFAATATAVDGDRGAFDLLLRQPGSIAVVHVAALARGPGVRALAIDGVEPLLENFARGSYQAGIGIYAVTAGAPGQLVDSLVTAMLGSDALPPDRVLRVP